MAFSFHDLPRSRPSSSTAQEHGCDYSLLGIRGQRGSRQAPGETLRLPRLRPSRQHEPVPEGRPSLRLFALGSTSWEEATENTQVVRVSSVADVPSSSLTHSTQPVVFLGASPTSEPVLLSCQNQTRCLHKGFSSHAIFPKLSLTQRGRPSPNRNLFSPQEDPGEDAPWLSSFLRVAPHLFPGSQPHRSPMTALPILLLLVSIVEAQFVSGRENEEWRSSSLSSTWTSPCTVPSWRGRRLGSSVSKRSALSRRESAGGRSVQCATVAAGRLFESTRRRLATSGRFSLWMREQMLSIQEMQHSDWTRADSESLYKLFDTRKSWDEAQAFCRNYNAQLAIVDSPEKNRFVQGEEGKVGGRRQDS